MEWNSLGLGWADYLLLYLVAIGAYLSTVPLVVKTRAITHWALHVTLLAIVLGVLTMSLWIWLGLP